MSLSKRLAFVGLVFAAVVMSYTGYRAYDAVIPPQDCPGKCSQAGAECAAVSPTKPTTQAEPARELPAVPRPGATEARHEVREEPENLRRELVTTTTTLRAAEDPQDDWAHIPVQDPRDILVFTSEFSRSLPGSDVWKDMFDNCTLPGVKVAKADATLLILSVRTLDDAFRIEKAEIKHAGNADEFQQKCLKSWLSAAVTIPALGQKAGARYKFWFPILFHEIAPTVPGMPPEQHQYYKMPPMAAKMSNGAHQQ